MLGGFSFRRTFETYGEIGIRVRVTMQSCTGSPELLQQVAVSVDAEVEVPSNDIVKRSQNAVELTVSMHRRPTTEAFPVSLISSFAPYATASNLETSAIQ